MQPGGPEEIQAIRAELEGLKAQVDAVGSAGGATWWTRAAEFPPAPGLKVLRPSRLR